MAARRIYFASSGRKAQEISLSDFEDGALSAMQLLSH
jgi:hypothetical protein